MTLELKQSDFDALANIVQNLASAIVGLSQVAGATTLQAPIERAPQKGAGDEYAKTYGPITGAEEMAVAKKYNLCLHDANELLREFANGRGLL